MPNTNLAKPTVPLNIRVTVSLKTQIEHRSRKAGISLTEYVSRILKDFMQMEEEKQNPDDDV